MSYFTTETNPPKWKQGWVLWHPQKGFGDYVNFSSFMPDAVTDRNARAALDQDDAWKVRQAKVVLED